MNKYLEKIAEMEKEAFLSKAWGGIQKGFNTVAKHVEGKDEWKKANARRIIPKGLHKSLGIEPGFRHRAAEALRNPYVQAATTAGAAGLGVGALMSGDDKVEIHNYR